MTFDEARWDRWIAVRQERGLEPDAPFQGDPLAELEEELLDAANYLEVAEGRYRIPHEVMFRAKGMLYELYQLSRTMRD